MLRIKQIDFVLRELKEKGYITRNYALKHYISRLGAIIYHLKQKGYDIVGERVYYDDIDFGKYDYKYILKGRKKQK